MRMVHESVKKAKCTTAGSGSDSYLTEFLSKLSTFNEAHSYAREERPNFCIYGDKWLSAIKYSIKCMKIDKDFTATKQVFEEVLGRVEAAQKRTDELMLARDAAYDRFLLANDPGSGSARAIATACASASTKSSWPKKNAAPKRGALAASVL
ncbi:hypothetical protein PybrP1_009270 [[Pythium] brassicae (nom. inval.)]|nr:hypothetical protein PybrP1_009270 [[Pythium] brassicae (nom. inval.)]